MLNSVSNLNINKSKTGFACSTCPEGIKLTKAIVKMATEDLKLIKKDQIENFTKATESMLDNAVSKDKGMPTMEGVFIPHDIAMFGASKRQNIVKITTMNAIDHYNKFIQK